MAYDETLAARIRRALAGPLAARLPAGAAVTEKRMFGGLCLLVEGRMVAGIIGSELCARIPAGPGAATLLARAHVRPMDFTGRPLKGFVYVAPEGLGSAAALRFWLEQGLAAAAAAPARPRRRKRRPSDPIPAPGGMRRHLLRR